MNGLLRKLVAGLLIALAPGFVFAEGRLGIVASDQAALRPAPRDSSKPNALLWQGDALEVRGERMEYLQVWNHRLERGGYVNARQVRLIDIDTESAPRLLAVVRFLRDTTGSESLGIAYAAAYLQAAKAESIRGSEGADVLDALGTFADRLARRASRGAEGKSAQAALSAHVEIAMHYGVAFASFERDSSMVVCYDGDAFRRVIDLGQGDAAQRAKAALALTRPECAPDDMQPSERRAANESRVELLDAVDVSPLPPYLRNRVHMRRAALWNSLAFDRARRGEPAQAAASRAQQELARVDRQELTDDDQRTYADAAMRVNASRWASLPAPAAPSRKNGDRPRIVRAAGQPGETCVVLVDAKHDEAKPLAKRCTYGIVWEESATLNREGNALALAVQHTESWREMWVFRKTGAGWRVLTLAPAATNPAVGYAEFAGWVPGGKQVRVLREASDDGKYRRSYEVMRLDTFGDRSG